MCHVYLIWFECSQWLVKLVLSVTPLHGMINFALTVAMFMYALREEITILVTDFI